MRKFHELEVAQLRRVTPDAVEVRFAVPDELREAFCYREGQHLTLRKVVDGEELRRSYSICAPAAEQDLRIVVRHLSGGRFSGFVNEQLKTGDRIEVFPPVGHFRVELDPARSRHYVAFVAGSGITPVMSIMTTVLETEPESRFTLFYGNRTADSTIFRSEISDLKNRHIDRFDFYHFLSRQELEIPFFCGRLDREKVARVYDTLLRGTRPDVWFVCGPDSMIDETTSILEARGIEPRAIHSERFINEGQVAGGVAGGKAPREIAASTGTIRAILDGVAHEAPYDPSAGSVLAALEAAGLEVPFSCRGGVCTTCRAKLLEGSAEMAVNFGLEDEEVAAGFILTCQAVPTSERVVISYDE